MPSSRHLAQSGRSWVHRHLAARHPVQAILPFLRIGLGLGLLGDMPLEALRGLAVALLGETTRAA